MDTVLNEVDFAIAYLDDILTKSENREQHADHVKEFSEKKNGFKLSMDTCEFYFFI